MVGVVSSEGNGTDGLAGCLRDSPRVLVTSTETGNEGVGANLVFALSGSCAIASQRAITRIAPTATFRRFDTHPSPQ